MPVPSPNAEQRLICRCILDTVGEMGVAAGTIAAKSRLAEARVVATSLREHHPDIPFFVLLTDEVDGYFDPASKLYDFVDLDELELDSIGDLAFRYDRDPLSYALTASFIGHLLDRGFDRVVFLKQESLVTGDLGPLLNLLETHPIVLTPHLLAPLAGADAEARELNVLLSGTYNVGVVGVGAEDEGRRFGVWWHERLLRHCRHAVADGMHFEQRWADLVPGYFERTTVLRDQGVNVAHWNVRERMPDQSADGQIFVGSDPCRLFRFSGYDRSRPEQLSRYVPDLPVDGIADTAKIIARYRAALDAAGHARTSSWPYAYAQFDNGVPIPSIARTIYAELDNVAGFGYPFVTGRDSYWAWLTAPVGRDVTRLWAEVHRRRPDLVRAFPNPLGGDRRPFVRWVASSGRFEYDVHERLAGPVRRFGRQPS